MRDVIFDELKKKVHLIKDLILSDMACVNEDASEGALNFSKHLFATRNWFARISWVNKKRYVLALMEDVRSVWTLSLLLKSMWNCRLKDVVLSISDSSGTWSSYDQVPMDHNRTAQPLPTLAAVMKTDRAWILSLDAEYQALVLSELLTIAGGPIMWAVLARAQLLYVRHHEKQLADLLECSVVGDFCVQDVKIKKDTQSTIKLTDKHPPSNKGQIADGPPQGKQTKEDLESHLAAWNSMIKALRDSLKLEELVMIFNDGTTKKIWKVNRMKPEATETVDYLQLLPAKIGRMILSHLPIAQLPECARVNKYWAFLIDELRAETVARQKLNADIEKMRDLVLRHDTSMEVIAQTEYKGIASSRAVSMAPSYRRPPPSLRPSEKSAGAYSFGRFVNDKLCKAEPKIGLRVPIRNMREMSERLDQRGAVDENLWLWCGKILRRNKIRTDVAKHQAPEGIISLGDMYFPCTLMKEKVEIPLKKPLCWDPTLSTYSKPKRNILSTTMPIPREQEVKRFNLWSKDFSSLYPVLKIPSYQSPGVRNN